jgi:hypothetical protein
VEGSSVGSDLQLLKTLETYEGKRENRVLTIAVACKSSKDLLSRGAAYVRGTEATVDLEFMVDGLAWNQIYNGAQHAFGDSKCNPSTGVFQRSNRDLKNQAGRLFGANTPGYAFDVKYAYIAALAVLAKNFTLSEPTIESLSEHIVPDSVMRMAREYQYFPGPGEVVKTCSGPINETQADIYDPITKEKVEVSCILPVINAMPEKATAYQRAPIRPYSKPLACHETTFESTLSAMSRVSPSPPPPVASQETTKKLEKLYDRVLEKIMSRAQNMTVPLPKFPDYMSEDEIYRLMGELDVFNNEKLKWRAQVKKQEVSSLEKQARLITCLPLRLQFAQSAYICSMLEQCVVEQYMLFMKKGLSEEKLKVKMGALLTIFDRFLSTDFKNFDSTVRQPFQRAEGRIIKAFAKYAWCSDLAEQTVIDKNQRTFKLSNKFAMMSPENCRKSGERMTSVFNFLALLVTALFTIEECDAHAKLKHCITEALLDGKYYDSRDASMNPDPARREIKRMIIGLMGEGDDAVRAYKDLMYGMEQLYDIEHHITCAAKCGMTMTLSMDSTNVIEFCSKLYAKCDSPGNETYAIVHPDRAHGRLPVQFNPPQSFTTAYGADPDGCLSERTWAECSVLALTSLVAYMENGGRKTPYVAALFYNTALYWFGKLEDNACGEHDSVYETVMNDGKKRKTLYGDVWSKTRDDLWLRLDNCRPDTDACPNALRKIIADYLKIRMCDIDIFESEVPTLTEDLFFTPEMFYVADNEDRRKAIGSRDEITGVVLEELACLTDEVNEVEPSVHPDATGSETTADDSHATDETVEWMAPMIEVASSSWESKTLRLANRDEITDKAKIDAAVEDPLRKLVYASNPGFYEAWCPLDDNERRGYLNKKETPPKEIKKRVGFMVTENDFSPRLNAFYDLCLKIIREKVLTKRQAGGDWHLDKIRMDMMHLRDRHFAIYENHQISQNAEVCKYTAMGQMLGNYRVGVNGRATVIYLENPNVAASCARLTTPHVTLVFHGGLLCSNASPKVAKDYDFKMRELGNCTAHILSSYINEELAKLGDYAGVLSESSTAEAAFHARISPSFDANVSYTLAFPFVQPAAAVPQYKDKEKKIKKSNEILTFVWNNHDLLELAPVRQARRANNGSRISVEALGEPTTGL